MGKIQKINKARKERKCGRCGNVIAVGDSYWKGTINFHPDVVRCTSCGLQSWEVTSSEYVLAVGEIATFWEKDYEINEETADSIATDLREIQDDTQDKFDNLPEQLQSSSTGEQLQERIDNLDSVIGELEALDTNEWLTDNPDEGIEIAKEQIQECLDALEF